MQNLKSEKEFRDMAKVVTMGEIMLRLSTQREIYPGGRV